MDQDQANHRFLTDGSYLVLTPRFSPNSQKITFMSYVKANSPRVFIFDIETGQQEIVGEFPGMTFAPRFSPDGKKIVMSYSDPDVGNSEIYILDLATRTTKRITNNSSIDVSGSFSPDGKKLYLILIEQVEDICMLLILMEKTLKELVEREEVIIHLYGLQEEI